MGQLLIGSTDPMCREKYKQREWRENHALNLSIVLLQTKKRAGKLCTNSVHKFAPKSLQRKERENGALFCTQIFQTHAKCNKCL